LSKCLPRQHSSAASFASLSAISLPCMPICDFTEQDSHIARLCSLHELVSDRFKQSLSGLWQSSTVDSDLRCMPIFCIEHFESVAVLSDIPGLQCLRAIKSTTSSALLIVFSMPCSYECTLRLRCARSRSLYTPESVTTPMCGISFLLPSVYMISFGRNLSSVL